MSFNIITRKLINHKSLKIPDIPNKRLYSKSLLQIHHHQPNPWSREPPLQKMSSSMIEIFGQKSVKNRSKLGNFDKKRIKYTGAMQALFITHIADVKLTYISHSHLNSVIHYIPSHVAVFQISSFDVVSNVKCMYERCMKFISRCAQK